MKYLRYAMNCKYSIVLLNHPFQLSVAFHRATSHSNCTVNQITGFYIKFKTGLKCVKDVYQWKCLPVLLQSIVFRLMYEVKVTDENSASTWPKLKVHKSFKWHPWTAYGQHMDVLLTLNFFHMFNGYSAIIPSFLLMKGSCQHLK